MRVGKLGARLEKGWGTRARSRILELQLPIIIIIIILIIILIIIIIVRKHVFTRTKHELYSLLEQMLWGFRASWSICNARKWRNLHLNTAFTYLMCRIISKVIYYKIIKVHQELMNFSKQIYMSPCWFVTQFW